MNTQEYWFLTGPTAAGKTAVGLPLARRIGAEIVSMDSMALYRNMDIGTAKPTAAERGEVPHHLIDVLDPSEEYSLAQYIEAAGRAAEEIAGRGKQVLFVGGTPLYLKGLLRGIFEGPPADWTLRRRLADEAKQQGPKWLHERLAAVDPASAARLHPNDERRLIRAIEVHEKTGHPISHWQRQFDSGRPAADCRVFVLDWPKPALDRRIGRRVQQMFADGLVDEVRGLYLSDSLSHRERARVRADAEQAPDGPSPLPLSERERGRSLSHTARQGVGYREVIEHIEGRHTLAETIELVETHTRQLAKRQMTWFRSLSECRFIAVGESLEADRLAEQIATMGMACPHK